MTVGSLFTGIGGFDLAAERVGFEVKWQVEIDDYCTKVLEKHWPYAHRVRDVQKAYGYCGEYMRGPMCLMPVDVICGGFPCQPVSLAGKRRAQADERWLWPDFARLIGELEPRYVVVENVPGLFTAGFDAVLGDLASIGYDAEWESLPAVAFGAPHIRERVWIVAYPGCELRGSLRDSQARATREWNKAAGINQRRSSDVADANGRRQQECQERDSEAEHDTANGHPRRLHADGRCNPSADANGSRLSLSRDAGTPGTGTPRVFTGATPHRDSWWAVEPDVGRVAHGIPARVDRLRGLGNAIVPQVAEWIFRQIQAAEERRIA